MNNHDLELDRRLAALELEVHRSRRATSRLRLLSVALAGALVGLGTVAATFAPAVPEVIQAHRFEIVDDRGVVVVAAKAGPAGGQVDIWSNDDRNVVRLRANEHGGDLALFSKTGRNVFGAYATEHGGESGIWSAGGALSVRQTTDDAGGRISIFNADGSAVLAAGPDKAGAGLLVVADAVGRDRLVAAGGADGGEMRIHGPGDNPVVVAGTAAGSGGGFVELLNAEGSRVFTTTTADDGGGRMDLANGSGTVVFSVNAIKDTGAALAIMNNSGAKAFLVGTRPQGGLMNLMNDRGETVFIAGTADDGGGGAISVKNGSGRQILHAGYDSLGNGLVTVWGAAGDTAATVSPRK